MGRRRRRLPESLRVHGVRFVDDSFGLVQIERCAIGGCRIDLSWLKRALVSGILILCSVLEFGNSVIESSRFVQRAGEWNRVVERTVEHVRIIRGPIVYRPPVSSGLAFFEDKTFF